MARARAWSRRFFAIGLLVIAVIIGFHANLDQAGNIGSAVSGLISLALVVPDLKTIKNRRLEITDTPNPGKTYVQRVVFSRVRGDVCQHTRVRAETNLDAGIEPDATNGGCKSSRGSDVQTVGGANVGGNIVQDRNSSGEPT